MSLSWAYVCSVRDFELWVSTHCLEYICVCAHTYTLTNNLIFASCSVCTRMDPTRELKKEVASTLIAQAMAASAPKSLIRSYASSRRVQSDSLALSALWSLYSVHPLVHFLPAKPAWEDFSPSFWACVQLVIYPCMYTLWIYPCMYTLWIYPCMYTYYERAYMQR